MGGSVICLPVGGGPGGRERRWRCSKHCKEHVTHNAKTKSQNSLKLIYVSNWYYNKMIYLLSNQYTFLSFITCK